jgi:adenosine kinase
MSALICGFLSYDTVMVFNDKFKHHLQSNMSALDVRFLVPDIRRQFGGNAGNIAYNLRLLGEKSFPMATVGTDFSLYADWLDSCGISRQYITVMEHCYTPQTFITIDMDDNHITAFHPGAMSFSQFNRIPHNAKFNVGIITADSNESMTKHALEFVDAGIPFVFNPSQSIHDLDGDELMKFIEQATWVLVNRSEWQVMQKRLGLSPQHIAQRLKALIVTLGADGSLIYSHDTRYQIPAATAKAVNDRMGCGAAYCAGLVYGLIRDIDWETTGRIASLMGAIKVEHHGTQNHTFSLDLFKARFKKNFGYALFI